MKIDPASIMDNFQQESWNVQNTIRSIPGVIIIMLKNQHEDGTPLWARVAFPDKVFEHASAEDWIKSKSRAGLGMSLGYLFNMLAAHDDLMGAGSADEARALLAQHGITAKTAVMKDAKRKLTKKEAGKLGGRGNKGAYNVRSFGNSADYLAGLLKRDHPEIAKAVERGEFKSIRAAAIKAGIVKVKTPLDNLRSAWGKASEEERETFKAEITTI
jgi:hypothetical protein